MTIDEIERLTAKLGPTDEEREKRIFEAMDKMKAEDLSPTSRCALMDEILVDMTQLQWNTRRHNKSRENEI